MIRVSFSLFLSFSVFCYFTLLVVIKIILLLFIYFYFFFHENYFYFFMFRNVPECSGMFRHVPECSVFRVLSTAIPSELSAFDIIQYMFVPQLEYFIKLVTGDDFSLLILIIKKDLRLNINRIDFSL